MDAAASLPLDLLKPASATNVPTSAKRADITRTAQAFEAQFLSSMFSQMLDGISTAPPFGGGEGEDAFRSFFSDALGREVAHHGGVGLGKAAAGEMLKLQGLS